MVYSYGLDQLTVNGMKEKGIDIIILNNLSRNSELEPGSILFINGEDVSFDQLFQYQEQFDEGKLKICYIDTIADMKRTVINAAKCSMRGIEYFSSKATIETFADRTRELLKMSTEQVSRIVGFFGSGTGAGATAVSTQFAKRIAAAGKTVCHLGLDLFDPGWNKKPNASLDSWRPKISAKIVQKEDFKSLMQIDNVTFLPGNFDFLASFDYRVEEIEYLLEKAQESFDVVVADFGSICDSAAWYVGMQRSAIRYIVTNSDHEYRLEALLDTIQHLGLDFNDFFGIFNRSNPSSGISARDLQKKLSMHIVLEIPNLQIDSERVMSLGKREQQHFDEQVRHLLVALGIQENETRRRMFG